MTRKHSILNGMNLRKKFYLKDGPSTSSKILTAVDSVDIDLSRGETLGIAGESGCGKSTLGNILAGLLKPDNGMIRYNGSTITDMTPSEYETFRRQTQMIFQDPFSSLNPRMRIGDIIAEPIAISARNPSKSVRSSVEQIMKTVGLAPESYNRFPHEFSGGQRQRIGIARALASSPTLIIADEPVSSLDISIQAQIINLLQIMKQEFNLSLVIISHDLSVLRHICDRISIMYMGVIVETVPAAELFNHYKHPYTEALIASIPQINRDRSQTRIVIDNDVPSPFAIPNGCRFHTRCRYVRDICRTEVPQLIETSAKHFTACHLSKFIFSE